MAHEPRCKMPPLVAEEWVGGRFPGPAHVGRRGAARPDLVLWINGDLIVLAQFVPGGAPARIVVDRLHEAMREPMTGAPRRPRRVRVSDPALAAAISQDGTVEVRVGPTPELEPVRAHLFKQLGLVADRRLPAYLPCDPGPGTEEAMAGLFRAAAAFYRAAPWAVLPYPLNLVGLELPSLGLEQGCPMLMGRPERDLGVLLLDSIERMCARRRDLEAQNEELTPDLMGPVFAIKYVRGAAVPRSMRREIDRHGWEVTSAHAYPRLLLLTEERTARPATQADVVLAWAVLAALHRMVERHGARLRRPARPLVETYVLDEVPGAPRALVRSPHPYLAEPICETVRRQAGQHVPHE